jgi:hypothetical protein
LLVVIIKESQQEPEKLRNTQLHQSLFQELRALSQSDSSEPRGMSKQKANPHFSHYAVAALSHKIKKLISHRFVFGRARGLCTFMMQTIAGRPGFDVFVLSFDAVWLCRRQ